MPKPDRNEQYRLAETLLAEQNIVMGVAGGIVGAIAGAIAWAAIAWATDGNWSLLAIGVGLLTGFGVRVFGRGIEMRFKVLAAMLAVFGCLLGQLFAGIVFDITRHGATLAEVLQHMSPAELLTFYRKQLGGMDVLSWLVAMVLAWGVAARGLTREQGLAVYAYEQRSPEQKIISD